MSTLHCLFSPDLDGAAARELRTVIAPGDAVLFLGPSARIAQADHPFLPPWLATEAALWVLQTDLQRFGVEVTDESLSVTDQSGFLALAMEHTRQMAWR